MNAFKAITLIVTIGLGIVTYQQVVSPIVNGPKTPNHPMNELWGQWKATHSKSYTAEEEPVRRAVFEMNVDKIQAHNAKGETWTLGLNQFADLTGEEFKATYATCAGSDKATICPTASKSCPELPSVTATSLNWTTSGAVTGVKNQEQCGSCWAFSTTGSLEGLYFKNHSILLSFSEQQLVDCDTSCGGCGGCWPSTAMAYTAQAGIELEAIYPYQPNGEGTGCKYQASLALKVNTGSQCVQPQNFGQMYSALTGQPVSIAVEADQDAWQLYAGGVVSKACGSALDHAVLIAGYSQNEEAWYVKNSWGTSWGMSGYIWISADAKQNDGYGVCGILSCGNLPTNN